MRLGVAAALLVAANLIATSSRAVDVLLVSDEDDAFNRRLIAEVESSGLEVEHADAATAARREHQGSASVVIEIDRELARVDVWLFHQRVRRHLGSVPLHEEVNDSVRVAELVRALVQSAADVLREKEPMPSVAEATAPRASRAGQGRGAAGEVSAGKASRGSGAVAPVPSPLEPPITFRRAEPMPGVDHTGPGSGDALERWTLDLSPAYVHQANAPAMSISLKARWWFSNPVGAETFVTLPLVPAKVEAKGAVADIDARMVGIGVAWNVYRSAAQAGASADVPSWRLNVGAGWALAFIEARGEAGPPHVIVRTESAVATLPYARVDATLGLSRYFGVTAGALTGMTLPRVDVVFFGDRMATWGWPLIAGSVGAQARFE